MNKQFYSGRVLNREQGAALLLALIILSLIMLVGVASLKQSNLQSLIAANGNASGVAFQAADTAIEAVLSDVEQQNKVLGDLAMGSEVHRCVVGKDALEFDECPLLVGGFGEVRAASVTSRPNVPDRAVTGTSTNIYMWRFYQTVGTGATGHKQFAKVENTQEFARRELTGGNNIYDDQGDAP